MYLDKTSGFGTGPFGILDVIQHVQSAITRFNVVELCQQ
jgi:hypothetical protein